MLFQAQRAHALDLSATPFVVRLSTMMPNGSSSVRKAATAFWAISVRWLSTTVVA